MRYSSFGYRFPQLVFTTYSDFNDFITIFVCEKFCIKAYKQFLKYRFVRIYDADKRNLKYYYNKLKYHTAINLNRKQS